MIVKGCVEMEFAEILKFLIALIPGIISALVVLPITSDSIRTKLFGAKGRALVGAKQELLRVVQEMFLSGQRIDDFTYKKLVASISKQFHISSEMLGSKDETLAQILQMINTSEVMPREYKRLLSNNLKKQFEDSSSDTSEETLNDESDYVFGDRRFEQVLKIWNEDCEQHQSYQYSYDTRLSSQYAMLPVMVSVLVGTLITFVVYISQNVVSFQIIACFLSFLLCVSILVSIIDSKTTKDIDFFRRLVYKIISLMMLMMLIVISIVIRL